MPLDIMGFIRKKKEAYRNRQLALQEGKLEVLEKDAEYARKQKKLLEREKAYRDDLAATKKLKQERRAARIAPLKKFGEQVRKTMKENAASGSKLEFGASSGPFNPGGENPFSSTKKKAPKQTTKTLVIKVK